MKRASESEERLLKGLTDSQREAVTAEGRVLVSASAGSGKTTAMVRKIVSEAEKGVSVKDMLILVYNEAAAAEIKDRLHSALFEAACLADGKKRRDLRDDIDALPSASIGTIHSFCGRFIRENFEKLGVSPSFDILGESEAKRYEEEALDAVFERLNASGDETYLRLADALASGRRENYFRAVVKKLYEVIEIQPDRAAFREKVRASYDDPDGGIYTEAIARSVREKARRAREVLEYTLPAHSVAGHESYAAKSAAMIPWLVAVEHAGFAEIMRLIRETSVLDMKCAVKSGTRNEMSEASRKTYASISNACKKLLADFADRDFIERSRAQNAEFVSKLLDIAAELDGELTAMKRADDVMSYSDLEHYAAELVRSGEFAGTFKQVYVDEYQDVNPVQEFIIANLLPEDAFMVGDVKQSIYGFRLADPAIFLGRKHRYERGEGGRAIEFNSNFRSVRTVLEFVNEVFDGIMTKETSDIDYAVDGHFEIGGEKKDVTGEPLTGAAEIHVFESCGSARSAPHEEAAFVISKIRELVGRVRKEDGSLISYGDCAILVRSRSPLVYELADRLEAAAIPVDRGILARSASAPEAALVRFLSVIDNPRNDIELAGFMLSFFGGFDESELALIAGRRPAGGDLYDAVLAEAKEDTPLGKKTAAMLDVLADYRLKASFKSVHELMQSIVSDFEYDAYVRASGEGGADKIVAFVAKEGGGDSHAGIGRFLETYAAASSAKKEGGRPSGGDRVHIATHHAYKGLESPVVFVVGTGAKFGGDKTRGAPVNVRVDNRGYVAMKHFDFGARKTADTYTMAALEVMEEERARKEELRLFYVALTRAKQYLYITGSCTPAQYAAFGGPPSVDPPKTLLGFLSDLRFRGGLKHPCVSHPSSGPALPVVRTEDLPSFGEAREGDVAAIKKALSFVYPHRTATGLAMKYSVSALDGGGDEVTLGAFADRADEGIAYHKVMEHIDFAAQGREGVERELDAMVASGAITEKERAEVDADAVARCLAHPVMQLARESVCHREKSFLMYVPAKEVGAASTEDRVLVQGVIDLLIDGRERVIVDFKNSALRSAEALEKYKKQLNLYKKAVESSFSGKVDRILLYSFKTGDIVELEKEG